MNANIPTEYGAPLVAVSLKETQQHASLISEYLES
jgi:hypothetical protein